MSVLYQRRRENKKMKKLFRIIKEYWVWITSKRVQEAINDESITYDEVCKIVAEEMAK